METFTIGVGHGWWTRIWSRNPLVRRSDRIEVLVAVLAVAMVIAAVPVAATIGTAVYDARSHVYVHDEATRHPVMATAMKDGAAAPWVTGVWFIVRAKWSAAGREHVEFVATDYRARTGDQVTIWVDDQGRYVGTQRPSTRATNDAVQVAVLVWLAAAGVAAGAVSVVRWRLDRKRYAAWECAIRTSAGDGGDRTNPRP
jgi:hypothetical protein